MLPNISADVIEKMKVLQPGNCVSFGGAFKIPMICKLDMPDPMPYSTNCNVSGCWEENKSLNTSSNTTPISNNYSNNEINNQIPVTEGVSTSELINDLEKRDASNDDFNPMSGLGDISNFG